MLQQLEGMEGVSTSAAPPVEEAVLGGTVSALSLSLFYMHDSLLLLMCSFCDDLLCLSMIS